MMTIYDLVALSCEVKNHLDSSCWPPTFNQMRHLLSHAICFVPWPHPHYSHPFPINWYPLPLSPQYIMEHKHHTTTDRLGRRRACLVPLTVRTSTCSWRKTCRTLFCVFFYFCGTQYLTVMLQRFSHFYIELASSSSSPRHSGKTSSQTSSNGRPLD